MNSKQRSELIVKLLKSNNRVSVSELAKYTSASKMTIRRDLEALENDGALRRIHGGAISAISISQVTPFSVRSQQNLDAKRRIAQKTASMLIEGDTVILDVGTTTLEIAKALHGRRNLTVFTPSLRAAVILAKEPGIKLIVSGGLVSFGEQSLVGDFATRVLSELIFDIFIMGAGGVHVNIGVTEHSLDDALVKRCALKSAQKCILVADSSKLDKVTFARVCPMKLVDVLITDEATPQRLKPYLATDTEVLTV
jgi:DeoR/GlpR family transcriptional regulator of sugar metabolism